MTRYIDTKSSDEGVRERVDRDLHAAAPHIHAAAGAGDPHAGRHLLRVGVRGAIGAILLNVPSHPPHAVTAYGIH